jgi:hypothetical protein
LGERRGFTKSPLIPKPLVGENTLEVNKALGFRFLLAVFLPIGFLLKKIPFASYYSARVGLPIDVVFLIQIIVGTAS